MKKILSIVLMITLSLSLLTGCFSKEEALEVKVETSSDLFEAAMEKNKDMKNTEFVANIEAELSDDPTLEETQIMGVEMNGKILDEKSMMVNMNIDTGQNMTISGSIYIKDDVVLVHAPILASMMGAEYIKLDMAMVAETVGASADSTDAEKYKDIFNKFSEETGYDIFTVFNIEESIEEVEITINEEVVNTKKLTTTLNVDGAVELIFAFLDYIAENQEAKDILFVDMTEEEIEVTTAKLKDPIIREEVQNFITKSEFRTLSYIMYIDEDLNMRKGELNIDATVIIEATEYMEEEVLDIKLKGNIERFNIGGVIEIILPEVDENQILDMSQMY